MKPFRILLVDQNGTDLPALIKALCPNYKVAFSGGKLPSNNISTVFFLI